MKCLLILIFGAFPLASIGAELSCAVKLNSNIIESSIVKTTSTEKVLISNTKEIVAYVTEKQNNSFTVEAFLANYEARIYADGFLTTTEQTLSATLWGRDTLVEIICHRL